MKTKQLSIFFPAYNDGHAIASLVTSFYHEALLFAETVQIIVVNDGSSDNTGQVLDELAHSVPALTVVHHPKNKGYGAALISGFEYCSADLIFYTDGDGQYSAADLGILFHALTPETDVVNGYKIKRGDNLLRICVGNAYKLVTRIFFGITLKDVDCDYRLIRKRAMQNITLTSQTGVICTEMVYKWLKNKCIIAEVPVNHYPRRHGRSQFFSVKHLKNAVVGLVVLWARLHLSSPESRPQAS